METTSHLLSTHSSSIPKKQGGCWPEPCFPWVKSLASSGLESARQPDLATKPSLSVPHPLEWSTYKRKRWHFTSFSEILGWSGPKYQSQRTNVQNVLISAFFSGFKWKKRHRSSKFEEKYYFYEKSQNFKEYNHPKKRRQIQVRSLVMKNIRLKPVMTSSAIRVLR